MGNSELLVAKQFDSFEELSALTQGWNTDFRQVAVTRLPHFLLQAQIDGVLVSHARFGCHVEQRGATPEKMRTFAVTHTECPEMHWFGHRAAMAPYWRFRLMAKSRFSAVPVSAFRHSALTWTPWPNSPSAMAVPRRKMSSPPRKQLFRYQHSSSNGCAINC